MINDYTISQKGRETFNSLVCKESNTYADETLTTHFYHIEEDSDREYQVAVVYSSKNNDYIFLNTLNWSSYVSDWRVGSFFQKLRWMIKDHPIQNPEEMAKLFFDIFYPSIRNTIVKYSRNRLITHLQEVEKTSLDIDEPQFTYKEILQAYPKDSQYFVLDPTSTKSQYYIILVISPKAPTQFEVVYYTI